jgi:hypothetical protein
MVLVEIKKTSLFFFSQNGSSPTAFSLWHIYSGRVSLTHFCRRGLEGFTDDLVGVIASIFVKVGEGFKVVSHVCLGPLGGRDLVTIALPAGFQLLAAGLCLGAQG